MPDKCPIHNQPLYVRALGNVVENDNTPDVETVLYYAQEQYCSVPGCKYTNVIKHPQTIIKLEG